MAQDKPETFSSELSKNIKASASHSTIGLLAGVGIGSFMAASSKLKGWAFAAKAIDWGFLGAMIGMVTGLWKERSDNQASALKMDSKLIHLEHENAWLKAAAEQGIQVSEHMESHTEKLKSERAAAEDCKCKAKH
jgi:hypothetical protein